MFRREFMKSLAALPFVKGFGKKEDRDWKKLCAEYDAEFIHKSGWSIWFWFPKYEFGKTKYYQNVDKDGNYYTSDKVCPNTRSYTHVRHFGAHDVPVRMVRNSLEYERWRAKKDYEDYLAGKIDEEGHRTDGLAHCSRV